MENSKIDIKQKIELGREIHKWQKLI